MGKKKAPVPAAAMATDGDIPVVGMREPCPCGSGRRYKACHGRVIEATDDARPFEAFVSEADLVALKELVPSATTPLKLLADPTRDVTLVTVLPMAYPAGQYHQRQCLSGHGRGVGRCAVCRSWECGVTFAGSGEPNSAARPH